jgi:PAS domain S-box-containing protein
MQRGDRNFRLDRPFAIAVATVAALLLGSAILSRYYTLELRAASRSVARTHEVVENLLQVVSLTNAAEGGQRGFLIVGDPLYLEPYHAAVNGVGSAIERVLDLTRDDIQQQERALAVRRRAQARLDILTEIIEARTAGGFGAALEILRSRRGKAEMDALRQEVDEMVRVERGILAERQRTVEKIYRRSLGANVASAVLGLLSLGLIASMTRRHFDRRERDATLIAEQSSRWQVTLASIGDAVITTDARGCVAFLNPEAERLTGWVSSAAAGYPLEQVFRIVNEATRAPVESPAARALREGIVVGLANHTVLLSRDGHEHPIDDSAAPIRDSHGEVTGVVLVFRDVSEARVADRDLHKLAADLAEADRRKNEFLAMLAHELRNPLAPIRNSIRLLQTGAPGSPPDGNALSALDRQSQQLVRLVDDLLDVSRISRGKIELRRARVDLREVALDALEAAKVVCEDTKQELLSELPERPLWADADATRLTQSIGNLIHNACKYSDPGGHIRVTLERQGDFGVLTVRDTGIGIAPNHLGRIFDMFAQVDTSLERARGGLGIGLTLVRQFVELHGGSVEAKSDGPGRGSEFRLKVPILPESAVVEPVAAEPAAPPLTVPAARSTSAAPERGKRRVLVVDDNHDAAETLSALLKLLGSESRIARDGEEALAVAENFIPDVVLLDIGLPKLNGFEVAQRLRSKPGGAMIRLVALTGWGQDEDRQRSREAGFDAHLVKPIDHEELVAILSAVEADREKLN